MNPGYNFPTPATLGHQQSLNFSQAHQPQTPTPLMHTATVPSQQHHPLQQSMHGSDTSVPTVSSADIQIHNNNDIDSEDNESKPGKRSGRRKIKIEYIEDKSRRHITFSKRKAGIMKKAYELSTLTGTQVLLLVVSETGLVYTFTTPKLQPLVTKQEGKSLIQECLNAPDPVVQQQLQQQQQQQQSTIAPSTSAAQLSPSTSGGSIADNAAVGGSMNYQPQPPHPYHPSSQRSATKLYTQPDHNSSPSLSSFNSNQDLYSQANQQLDHNVNNIAAVGYPFKTEPIDSSSNSVYPPQSPHQHLYGNMQQHTPPQLPTHTDYWSSGQPQSNQQQLRHIENK